MSIAEKLSAISENEQKVYEAGKQAEWSQFWDGFQDEGSRRGYNYGFYSSYWNDANFKPKYDMRPTTCSSMFQSSSITDMVKSLNDAGVTIDFSGCGGLSYTFYQCASKTLPIIDTTGAATLSYSFLEAAAVSIEKLILKSDGSQTFTSPFNSAYDLKDIVIEGVIGNNISFATNTKLTHDSLMSIINALKNHSESGTTYTCTLRDTNLAKLTDTEKAIATEKGWTLA